MNEQNSDSFSQEATSSLSEGTQIPSETHKTRRGILDTMADFFHKKSENIIDRTSVPSSSEDLGGAVAIESGFAPIEESIIPSVSEENISPLTEQITPPDIIIEPLPVPHKKRFSMKAYFNRFIPKKKIVETIPPVENVEGNTFLSSEQMLPDVHEEVPVVLSGAETTSSNTETGSEDVRFAQLLQQDTVYQSMIRSEDVSNIRLQLAMRYMLLMLAIFVVIAWVVNNRIIMFGFADFPILARTRDILFAVLTGLFCLTLWFGSVVWFHHRIGAWVLRSIAVIVFVTVLFGIYLPLWR